MRDIVREVRTRNALKKSRQEQLDEEMCRPGYRWSGKPLYKCLPAASYRIAPLPDDFGNDAPSFPLPDRPTNPQPPSEPPSDSQPAPEIEMPAPEEAIAKEMIKRQNKKVKENV